MRPHAEWTHPDFLDHLASELVEHQYSILPAQLPPDIVDTLVRRLEALDRQGLMQPAATGRGEARRLNSSVRSDLICWLQDEDPVDAIWLDFAEQIRRGLNERLFLGLDFYEAHYAHYAPGAAYARHRDAFVGQRNRIVSTVLYLNRDWQEADGGQLLVYDEAAATVLERVQPRGGTLMVFLSERLPHEVLPARRSRYSIAGWFRQRS